MSRIRDEELFEALDEIEEALRDIKAGTQALGADSVLGYLTRSDALFDYQTSLNAGQTKTFVITFTHDNSLYGSIQDLAFFYGNNPDVMNTYIPPWATGPDVFATLQKMPPTNTQNTWRLSLRNDSGVTLPVYCKLFFSGTDSGTWNIV